MSLIRKIQTSRPRLKPYLLSVGLLLVILASVLLYVYVRFVSADMELVGLSSSSKIIISSIVGIGTLIFGLHWAGNAYAKDLALQKSEMLAYVESIEQRHADELRTYALEIRGSGLAVDRWYQTSLWRKIREHDNSFTSVFSRSAEDYPNNLETRRSVASFAVRSTFRPSAGNTVAYWPVPAFAVAPPKPPERMGASNIILDGRNAASLGVNLFTVQAEDNTLHLDTMINKAFDFMAENKTVPELLFVSNDGDVLRNGLRTTGAQGLPRFGRQVPVIFETVTGIVLARSDRVDRYLRPFAVQQKENNQDRSTDLGKLWAFYWQKNRSYANDYAEQDRAKGGTGYVWPGTQSTSYWHSQLPELQKQLRHHGPVGFQPSPWLPIRWAEHQIKEFDASPLLGHLHPPVKVSMLDADGKSLKPALQAQALQAGWLKALEGLPNGLKPVRVFYDSTDNTQGEIALTTALHALNTDGLGLDLSQVEEGYDIGRRLGNTGVSSPMVQINLATFASYLEGGVSAVVYNGAHGNVTVQMVRPPSDEAKAKNAKTRGDDPFVFGMPR